MSIEYHEFQQKYADEIVVMWRASFERAVGIVDPHPLEEQREFLLNEIVPNNDLRIAIRNEAIVGFVAASPESIAQLYIHVNFQRRGIGSQLLEWAQNRSNGSLWLYTYENNMGAQRFYERKGFKVIARSFEEQWQLNDIKYEWTRPSGGK